MAKKVKAVIKLYCPAGAANPAPPVGPALGQHGVTTALAIQGIDPVIFKPTEGRRQLWNDKFVIFSGGKFELRKGQDIVIRAFKALSERHEDVRLITSWFNSWPSSVNTMIGSTLIRFAPFESEDYQTNMDKLLSDNGITPNKALHLLPQPNTTMANVYHNSDLGLFPNRCEGGTNLVMMEYMACGKSVVATFNTGHCDVLTPENAFLVSTKRTIPCEWGTMHEPDLDEVIDQMEVAYSKWTRRASVARQAATDMHHKFTWAHTAKRILEVIECK